MAKKILVTGVVLSAFRDKFDHKTRYPAGMELQVDERRAKNLVSRGLARLTENNSKEPEQPQPTNPETVPESPAPLITPAGSGNPEKKEEDERQRTEKQ